MPSFPYIWFCFTCRFSLILGFVSHAVFPSYFSLIFFILGFVSYSVFPSYGVLFYMPFFLHIRICFYMLSYPHIEIYKTCFFFFCFSVLPLPFPMSTWVIFFQFFPCLSLYAYGFCFSVLPLFYIFFICYFFSNNFFFSVFPLSFLM